MIPIRQAEPPARGVTIGHVHLKVADLDRAVDFYTRVIGLDLMQTFRDQAAFLSCDGYHHHLGLNVWESAGGTPPPPGHTGLFHTAFLYPDRAALGRAAARVIEAGIALEGAADHGVSEAVYLSDPDGNGIELYRDRAPEEWPLDDAGRLAMVNAPLEVDALIADGR